MALLSVQDIVEGGLEATYASATGGGDTVKIDGNAAGRLFLHVRNGHSSPQTVTVTPATTSANVPGFGTLTRAAIAVAVTNAEERFIPITEAAFANSSGLAAITYSGVTSLTIAAIRLPAPIGT